MHRHAVFKGHSHPIIQFLVTNTFVFSLGEGGEFIVFSAKGENEGSVISKLQIDSDLNFLMHPVTYVNKLVFAGKDKLHLWNVVEKEQVYTFKQHWASPIECVVQSPVVDVVAVGCADGSITLVNLLYDEVLL